jgi:hypothetical protein
MRTPPSFVRAVTCLVLGSLCAAASDVSVAAQPFVAVGHATASMATSHGGRGAEHHLSVHLFPNVAGSGNGTGAHAIRAPDGASCGGYPLASAATQLVLFDTTGGNSTGARRDAASCAGAIVFAQHGIALQAASFAVLSFDTAGYLATVRVTCLASAASRDVLPVVSGNATVRRIAPPPGSTATTLAYGLHVFRFCEGFTTLPPSAPTAAPRVAGDREYSTARQMALAVALFTLLACSTGYCCAAAIRRSRVVRRMRARQVDGHDEPINV